MTTEEIIAKGRAYNLDQEPVRFCGEHGCCTHHTQCDCETGVE